MGGVGCLQLKVAGNQVSVRGWLASGSASSWTTVTDSSVSVAGATRVSWSRVAGANTAVVDGFRQFNTSSSLSPFVTYSYDDDGRVIGEALVSGSSRGYTYTDGRVTQVTQSVPGANRTTNFSYDVAGSVSQVGVVGGDTTSYGYDNAGQVVTATHSASANESWSYDGAGRRSSYTVGSDTTTYSYNARSQLTLVDHPTGPDTTYTYDQAGRRTGEATGTATVAYTYNPLGQTATITRSNSGTTITKEDRSYHHDGLLRRVTTTGPSDTFLRYVKYDWDTTTTVPELVTVLDGSSNTAIVSGPTGPVASTKANVPTLFGLDGFGSVINSTGQSFANASGYDTWGNPTGSTATAAPTLGYRGELNTQTGLYLRARDYNPNTGQFTTIDPLDDITGTPTSGNPYHYVNNDPINWQDPLGLAPGLGAPTDHNFGNAFDFLLGAGSFDPIDMLGNDCSQFEVGLGTACMIVNLWGATNGQYCGDDLMYMEVCYRAYKASLKTRLASVYSQIAGYASVVEKLTSLALTAGLGTGAWKIAEINDVASAINTWMKRGGAPKFDEIATVAGSLLNIHKSLSSIGRIPTPSGTPARFIDSGGAIIDRASIRTTVSAQRQGRHVLGDRLYSGGSYFNSADDAQRVLDDFHSGAAEILGIKGNDIVVRSPNVTGFNHNPGAGFPNQATNVFFIKGSANPSVVPYNPNWTP